MAFSSSILINTVLFFMSLEVYLLSFNFLKKVLSTLLISSLNSSCKSFILSLLRSYRRLVPLLALLSSAVTAGSKSLTPHKALPPFLITLLVASFTTAQPTDVVPISNPIL